MSNVKSRSIHRSILCSFAFILGVLAGALAQKTMGVGNILRAAGIPYPTSRASSGPTVLPIVKIPAAYRGQMLLFILAGQSNMVGWAPIREDNRTDPRIFVFSNDYHWRMASEPVDNAYNQVDQISLDRFAFFGPSMAFALASLDRQPQIIIGLIPCAKGSSAIAEWQRNPSDQSLYGSCLKRALAASPMGHMSGILFFQGETDAQDPKRFPHPEPHPFEWAKLFTAFVADLRQDLQDPDLPVVLAQLGSDPVSEDFPNWNIVKKQQSSLELPMTAMITTDDLPLMDGLHFTADSYQIIGKRFADAYWDLVERRPVK